MFKSEIKKLLKLIKTIISIYINILEKAILVYGVRQDNLYMLFPLSSLGIVYHYRKKNNTLCLRYCLVPNNYRRLVN